jgi:hypothetical protein
LLAPADARLVTDHIGRPVKLRWSEPDESVHESDAQEVYDMAANESFGFRFVS